MKNLKSTEPIYLDKKNGWCADIYEGEKSSVETDICTVWGSSEEELNYRVTMIKKAYEMREALKVIRDSFWTEPSESKKHIELQDIAKSILKEMKS